MRCLLCGDYVSVSIESSPAMNHPSSAPAPPVPKLPQTQCQARVCRCLRVTQSASQVSASGVLIGDTGLGSCAPCPCNKTLRVPLPLFAANQLAIILEFLKTQRQGVALLARQMMELRNDIQRVHL